MKRGLLLTREQAERAVVDYRTSQEVQPAMLEELRKRVAAFSERGSVKVIFVDPYLKSHELVDARVSLDSESGEGETILTINKAWVEETLNTRSKAGKKVDEESEEPFPDSVEGVADFVEQRRSVPVRCAVCGKKSTSDEALERCSVCRAVCYCSKEHQKSDWKEHKKVCKKATD
ncbi:hypothetical protein KFL_012430010 [Klebsormidium nitens]|uniref:MYND-type domain-containing protein n=1 Tax=Klebsormidium nitens TaxID=105231 RepID=A0A1Y1ISH9_KLENI|nr:hypothetical protein KFL_012430010 [Klebsormidium nitens]|eukprot:GAQ93002.1 hypothetical protein KFL_012430010 [Klebsormidium nitens]